MGKKAKKIVAALLCMILVGVSSNPVSAASDLATWTLKVDPGGYKTSQNVVINTYGPGYVAYITKKSGDSPTNSVTITAPSAILNKTVHLDTANAKFPFNTVGYSGTTITFTVQLNYASGYKTYNNGTIRINQ